MRSTSSGSGSRSLPNSRGEARFSARARRQDASRCADTKRLMRSIVSAAGSHRSRSSRSRLSSSSNPTRSRLQAMAPTSRLTPPLRYSPPES